jgi:hypothetical protein
MYHKGVLMHHCSNEVIFVSGRLFGGIQMLLHLPFAFCGPGPIHFDHLSLIFTICGLGILVITAFFLVQAYTSKQLRYWLITGVLFVESGTTFCLAIIATVPIYVCNLGPSSILNSIFISMEIICLWKIVETLSLFAGCIKMYRNGIAILLY